ncbi:tyrosinase-like protein [Argopecten irradians]|uniref:tyrosinase-like protein n=1 Tax=Argopecten irradians TaxID=31199 RepID=UPI0037156D7D
MMKAMAGLVLACVAGFMVISVRGQLSQPSAIGNCEQFRDQRGQFQITENDESMYCFHRGLYESVIVEFSLAEAPEMYTQSLLKNALSRCITGRQRKPKTNQSTTKAKPAAAKAGTPAKPQKVCKSRKCRRARYRKRVKRTAVETQPIRVRVKRQSRSRGKCDWIRKEVRTLSRPEWEKFTRRMNILKRQISIPGSGSFIPYDIISDMHRGSPNLDGAYGGPGFPGWNRLYLLVIEAALGMPVPYWDSRKDFDMDEPTQSVLWTDLFYGPGVGIVDSGPFAGWITSDKTSLRRDIGTGGSLMSQCMVEQLLKSKNHGPFVEPTLRSISLEKYQSGVHRWVGEQLSLRRTASQDPIFFLHRSFVDYIWRMFRDTLRSKYIKPSLDYPEKGSSAHDPTMWMLPFGNLPNTVGYSDFIERLTEFGDSPACPKCGNSEFLICDTVLNRCKSKAKVIMDKAVAAETREYRRQALAPKLRGKKFKPVESDPRTQGNPF